MHMCPHSRVVAAVHNWWTMVITVSLYWISSFDPCKYIHNSPKIVMAEQWTPTECEREPWNCIVVSRYQLWPAATTPRRDGLVTCRQRAPGSANQRLNYHLAGSLQRNSLIHIIHATAQQFRSCSGKYFCLQCNVCKYISLGPTIFYTLW